MTRSRYIIIGDVHGCLTELQALLCRIVPKPDDTLVFLGDLVDKGPESPGVVRWVRHLSTLYRVVLIEGNHEEKHRRWRQHMRLGSPVVHTMTGTQQIAAITQAMSAADIAFWRRHGCISVFRTMTLWWCTPGCHRRLLPSRTILKRLSRIHGNNVTSMGKCSASGLSHRKGK